MQKLMLVLLLGSALSFPSCSLLDECGGSKDNFLKTFESFIDEAKQKDWHYADNDWKPYDDKLESYIENCYERFEEEMSATEIRDFWTQTVTFYVKRYDREFIDEFFDEKNEVSQSIRKHVKKFERDPERFFKEILREVSGGEVDELFRDLGKELENMGKQLQDWLDER